MGVEEAHLLVEDGPEEVEPEASDDALLGHAEEINAPEIHQGVHGAAHKEVHHIPPRAIVVPRVHGPDRLVHPMRHRERKGEPKEKGRAARVEPPPVWVGELE